MRIGILKLCFDPKNRRKKMKLTKEELSALEEFAAGFVPWKIIERIPLQKFAEDEPPSIMLEFGGTYIAKTVLDGESVWAVVSKRKGKLYYGTYADSLRSLLAGL